MSREAVLENIRRALAGSHGGSETNVPTLPVSALTADREGTLALFLERLAEYDARVFRATPASLTTTIPQVLDSAGRRRILVPAGVPPAWLTGDITFVVDSGLDHATIDGCDGVLTGASAAVAESGSLVLRHSLAEGRRVLTLLPDYHLCIIDASQVYATLPECMTYLESAGVSLITFISGPSATADIEMTRIRGVHGPRSLDVILVCSTSGATPETL